MKVHTEGHYGNRLGNLKYQVSALIHYQDMEIFYFSVFLIMQLYFPTNCLERDELRTVGIFAISQLVRELFAKEEFLFLTMFLTVYSLFSTFLHLKIYQKL